MKERASPAKPLSVVRKLLRPGQNDCVLKPSGSRTIQILLTPPGVPRTKPFAVRKKQAIRDVAGEAGKKAGEVFDDAKTYYDRASHFYDTGAKVTRASTAATEGVLKAREWIKKNPGKAAVVSFSLVLGVRMGAGLPGLDAVLLRSEERRVG